MRDLFLKKLTNLRMSFISVTSDIVMVSETWLSKEIPDEALHFPGIPGFSVIWNDRMNQRGSGVALFIKDTIPFQICRYFISLDQDCLWIIFRPKWLPKSISKIAKAYVYLPPSLNSGEMEDFFHYFCNCYDTLTSDSPSIAIVAGENFNSARNGF